MNAMIYHVGTEKVSHRATLEDAIAWLTGIYGDDPSAVGMIDGTEDDFGDLVYADLPFVVLGRVPDDDYDRCNTLEDRLVMWDNPTWAQVINLAQEVLS